MAKRLALVMLTVLISAVGSANAARRPTTIINDSTRVVKTVLNFMHWYKNHIDSASRISLVNQKPGKVYSVNIKNGERYLAYLKSSNLLTDNYLAEWRTYFNERQAGFRASPQNEGPPLGFEYDLVLLSQDVDKQIESLKTLKIERVAIRQNRASAKFLLLFNYEFRLVKLKNRWLINEILNLSAE